MNKPNKFHEDMRNVCLCGENLRQTGEANWHAIDNDGYSFVVGPDTTDRHSGRPAYGDWRLRVVSPGLIMKDCSVTCIGGHPEMGQRHDSSYLPGILPKLLHNPRDDVLNNNDTVDLRALDA